MLPTLDGLGPLHDQLYRWLRASVLDGRLAAGERIPPSREMAAISGLSRNTVLHAYERLGAEGYVVCRRGAGTFVARGVVPAMPAPSRVPADRSLRLSRFAQRARQGAPTLSAAWQRRSPSSRTAPYDFQYGEPMADRTAWQAWRRHLSRRAQDMPTTYPPVQGLLRLREAIADFLWRRRGMRVDAGRVLIVNGSQQALDLIARVLLDPGCTAALEDPGYPGARLAFAAAGARLRGCPVDSQGLHSASLPAPQAQACLCYVTPSHQFPTGALLPLARRLELLDWAARNDAFVVEDDYDSDYCFLARPLQAVHALDAHDRVIYLASFAKVLTPALRLGYMVLPQRLVEPMLAAKFVSDRGCALADQAALADFIENTDLDRHIRRTRNRLQRQRDALLQALERAFGDGVQVMGAHAGMHVTVWFRDLPPPQVEALCKAALASGVRAYPLQPYFMDGGHCSAILLGYATLCEDAVEAGIHRLAQAHQRLGHGAGVLSRRADIL
ncbi:MAG TPA: PLP-dependent aminotransferase family protein [Gammaproteobacteria bacterium]|nr:PLP-dependent aminotransferase family protein [Gammaproteobacteria bacterium]